MGMNFDARFYTLREGLQELDWWMAKRLKGIGPRRGIDVFWKCQLTSSRHLIPTVRSSSAGGRNQTLTECFLGIGEEQRMHLSNTLPRLFKEARKTVDKTWGLMQALLERLKMSPEELQQQADLMHQYSSTPTEEAPKSVFDDDEICEILLCQEILLEHINHLLNGGPFPAPGSWKRLREFLAARVNGRIPPSQQLPSVLDVKLQVLFTRFKCTMSDWIDKDNNPTERYLEARERYVFRELRLKKSEIFEVWYKRNCELDCLHSSGLGMSPVPCDFLTLRNEKGRSKTDKY